MHVNALVRTKLYKHEPLKAGLTHPDNAVGDLNTPACTLEWAKALCTCSKVPPVFILSTVKHTLRIQFPELSLLRSPQRMIFPYIRALINQRNSWSTETLKTKNRLIGRGGANLTLTALTAFCITCICAI